MSFRASRHPNHETPNLANVWRYGVNRINNAHHYHAQTRLTAEMHQRHVVHLTRLVGFACLEIVRPARTPSYPLFWLVQLFNHRTRIINLEQLGNKEEHPSNRPPF